MASPRGTKRRADDPSSPYTGLSRPLSIENSAVEYEQLKERIRLRNRSLNASRLLDPLSPPRYLSRSDVERPMASGPHVARPELDYGDRDGNHGSYSGRVDDGAAQRRESLEEGEIRREGEDRMNSPFPHTFSPDRPTTATAMGSPPPQRNPIQPRDYEPQMRPPGSRPAHPGWPTIAQDQYEDRTAPSVPHPSHQLRPTLKTKFVNGATVPITCRWWKFGGATGCHNTAETCPYAHFDTGVYAELGPRSVVAGSRKRWKKKKRLVQNAADPGMVEESRRKEGAAMEPDPNQITAPPRRTFSGRQEEPHVRFGERLRPGPVMQQFEPYRADGQARRNEEYRQEDEPPYLHGRSGGAGVNQGYRDDDEYEPSFQGGDATGRGNEGYRYDDEDYRDDDEDYRDEDRMETPGSGQRAPDSHAQNFRQQAHNMLNERQKNLDEWEKRLRWQASDLEQQKRGHDEEARKKRDDLEKREDMFWKKEEDLRKGWQDLGTRRLEVTKREEELQKREEIQRVAEQTARDGKSAFDTKFAW